MGNCLVTKLKGTVDNSNLERLGYIAINVLGIPSSVPVNNSLGVIGYGNKKMYIKGATFLDGTTEHTITTSQQECYNLFPKDVPFTLYLPKYDTVTDIYTGEDNHTYIEVDIDEFFKYRTDGRFLRFYSPFDKFSGNLSVMAEHVHTLYSFNVYGANNIKGTLEDIKNLFKDVHTSFTFLIINIAANPDITGNIKNFFDSLASQDINFGKVARRLDWFSPGCSLDTTGIDFDVTRPYFVDFDGNGGYTLTKR